MKAYKIIALLFLALALCVGMMACDPSDPEETTTPEGTDPSPITLHYAEEATVSEETMKADLLINEPIDKVVMHYAHNAMEAGLDGVVCSPLEAGKVHDTCGKNFVTVTPA